MAKERLSRLQKGIILVMKRGNKWGTMASITWGMIVYALANTVVPQIRLWGTHASFVSVFLKKH